LLHLAGSATAVVVIVVTVITFLACACLAHAIAAVETGAALARTGPAVFRLTVAAATIAVIAIAVVTLFAGLGRHRTVAAQDARRAFSGTYSAWFQLAGRRAPIAILLIAVVALLADQLSRLDAAVAAGKARLARQRTSPGSSFDGTTRRAAVARHGVAIVTFLVLSGKRTFLHAVAACVTGTSCDDAQKAILDL
jgi:hypothetical protein